MTLKSWFKSKPYWLRGGILIYPIFLVLAFLSFILGFYGGFPLIFYLVFLPLYLLPIFLGLNFGCYPWHCDNDYTTGGLIALVIIFIIELFVLGSIIGFMVGKIKKRL